MKLLAKNGWGGPLALLALAVAAGGCTAAGEGSSGGGLGGPGILIYLALFGAIIYFLMIRPQRRRTRQQQELNASLEVGDNVRTIGGLFGMVVGIADDHLVLAMEEGRIRVSRSAIAGKVGGSANSDPGTDIMGTGGN